MRPKVVALIIIFSACVARAQAPAANPNGAAAQARVRHVVETWLATMDEGKHSETWKTLARSARKTDEAHWLQAFQKKDQRFGKRKGRRFMEMHEHPGRQPGEPPFYLIEYHSVSADGHALRELVRVVKDSDAQWRVAGYSIEERQPGGEHEEEED